MTELDDLVDAVQTLKMAIKSAQDEFAVPFGASRSVFMSSDTAKLLFPMIAEHLNDQDENGKPRIWQMPFAGDQFSIVLNDQLGIVIYAI